MHPDVREISWVLQSALKITTFDTADGDWSSFEPHFRNCVQVAGKADLAPFAIGYSQMAVTHGLQHLVASNLILDLNNKPFRFASYHELAREICQMELANLDGDREFRFAKTRGFDASELNGFLEKELAHTIDAAVGPRVVAAPARRPAKAVQGKKGKNINARMLEAIYKDESRRGWTARQWAAHLKCSPSTIIEKQVWNDLRGLRELEAAKRTTDRRKGR